MSDGEGRVEERLVRTPRLGTKVTWLVGGLLLIAAIYFAFVPLTVIVQDGSRWGCGNAVSGPPDAFGAGLCGAVNKVHMWRAGALALAAALLAGGGTYLFGMDEKVIRRTARPAEDF